MIYLLTAIGLSPNGSSTAHIYTQTIHRTTQITTEQHKKTTNLEECGPCPIFASFTLAFALQLRKNHGETSVRVRKRVMKQAYSSETSDCMLSQPRKTIIFIVALIHTSYLSYLNLLAPEFYI